MIMKLKIMMTNKSLQSYCTHAYFYSLTIILLVRYKIANIKQNKKSKLRQKQNCLKALHVK